LESSFLFIGLFFGQSGLVGIFDATKVKDTYLKIRVALSFEIQHRVQIDLKHQKRASVPSGTPGL
ncbi:hypothetical protein S83_039108, partial [Arachis hypogaea]